MITVDDHGFSSLVIKPEKALTRRQDSPEVFDMTTVAFIASIPFVKSNSHIFDGKVRSVYIPRERSIDIDTAYDMEIAEYLANKLKDLT
jgi:N-acylneuraminate cytidylyltransferase